MGWLEGQTGGQRVGRAARGRADFLRRPPLTPSLVSQRVGRQAGPASPPRLCLQLS